MIEDIYSDYDFLVLTIDIIKVLKLHTLLIAHKMFLNVSRKRGSSFIWKLRVQCININDLKYKTGL